MSTNFHTPYEDGVTEFKAADMNSPLGELDEALAEVGSGIYDIGGTFENVPGNSQVLLRYPLPRDVVFQPGMPDSQMVTNVAATAETVFSIKKDDVEFATATFAIAGLVASFTSGSGANFSAGEVLTMVSPASADATLANLGWSLVAGRSILSTTTTSSSSSSSTSSTNSTTSTTDSTTSSSSSSSTTTTTS